MKGMQVAGIFPESGNKQHSVWLLDSQQTLKAALRRDLGVLKFVKILQWKQSFIDFNLSIFKNSNYAIPFARMRHTNPFQKADSSISLENLAALAGIAPSSKGWKRHRGTPKALFHFQIQNVCLHVIPSLSTSFPPLYLLCLTWTKTSVAVWKSHRAVICSVTSR